MCAGFACRVDLDFGRGGGGGSLLDPGVASTCRLVTDIPERSLTNPFWAFEAQVSKHSPRGPHRKIRQAPISRAIVVTASGAYAPSDQGSSQKTLFCRWNQVFHLEVVEAFMIVWGRVSKSENEAGVGCPCFTGYSMLSGERGCHLAQQQNPRIDERGFQAEVVSAPLKWICLF